MLRITRNDIQLIDDEATLIHFLEEKLNLPIPEGATLAQIALPLPLPFLGLAESITEQIIDCQDFSGLPKTCLGTRRPFLIRFRRESGYPEILREVAWSLYQKNANPADFFFICAGECFQPFAFAHFNDSETQDWRTAVLNILAWTQANTHIHTNSEHQLPVSFFLHAPATASDAMSETQTASPDYRGEPSSSKDLLIKLQNTGTPLGQHWNIHTGLNLGCKDAFVIDQDTYKRLIDEDANSADLLEWFPDKPGRWRWELRNLIYIPSSKNKQWAWSGKKDESEAERLFETSYPAISAHMNEYKARLKKSTTRVEFYWEFGSRSILQKLEQPKIIYRMNYTYMQAAYDTSHRFLTNATYFIPTTDLSLLAILNSKLFAWYAHKEYWSPKYKRVFFSKENMEKTPIASRTEEQKEEFGGLVQQILNDPEGLKVPDIEQEIDRLVYKMYELTVQEIVRIEAESNP